jgi:error-prone DNA polymerase
LAEVVPVEHARMPNRRVVQFDKDSVERAGLVKIDILSLGMLAAIDRCFDYLEARDGVRPALHGFTCDDPRVYDLICEPDTIGLFQIESRAQQNACLPQLQPRTFEDLVAAVAIIRPGPIQADATHPFLRRRQGLEPVTYPGGAIGRRLLEPVLGSTAGVCIFQDQVIEIARRCGLRPDEAAELRRAMSSNRSPERMAALRQRLLEGLAAVGLDAEAQAQVVKVIEAFSGFGFVRGHAASFAYLAYVSAWLKRYHGAALAAALLETQPMGFYRVEMIVQDAQRHGVTVLPVDLRRSRAEATVEGTALRLGLRQITGLGDETCRRLEAVVAATASLDDLRAIFAAAEVTEGEVRALARGGALDGYFSDRRQALWHAPLLARDARQRPLLPMSTGQRVPLVAPTPLDTFMLDHQTLGFSVQGHVLRHVRPRLQRPLPRACDLANLPLGAHVEIVGQFELRQQPATAHGMRFILLSDETGLINLVATPNVYRRYRSVIRSEPLLWVEGVLERRGRSVSIRVRRIRRGVDLLRPEAATY